MCSYNRIVCQIEYLYSEIGPSLGPKMLASIMRLESTSELCLGPTQGGHYNEVVLLQKWLLSEVSLFRAWFHHFYFNKTYPS